MKRVILSLLFFQFALCSFAETLEQCQELAYQNFPLVKRYDLIAQSSQYTVANLNRGWLPQIIFSAQASLQSDVVTLPDALKNAMSAQGANVKGLKKDQYKVALDLQQNIWDGGATSAQKEVALRQQDLQNTQNSSDIYALRERVNDLFFGSLLVEEKVKLCKILISLIENNCKRLENLKEEGVAMESEVFVIQAELLSAKQQYSELESTHNALISMLSLFCGHQIEALEDDGTLTDSELSLTGVASLHFSDFSNRPEMKVLDKQDALVSAQLKALDAKVMPHFSLFAQGYYGYPGLNMYEDMFSHDWSLNGIVGLRMNWNISNLYTRNNDKKKLLIQKETIENSREIFVFNTRLQQTQEEQYTQRCQKLISQDDEIIALRKKVREAAEAKLDNGIIDVNGLLQEISREQKAEINRIQHLIEMKQHIAELKYIKGE